MFADRKATNSSHPFTVFIEGNIGSGKSTFLKHFQQFDDVCLLKEPVEEWRNCGGTNLLVSKLNGDLRGRFLIRNSIGFDVQ